MNKRTILAALIVIVLLPLVYVLLNGFEREETRSFRGVNIRAIEAQDGTVTVPTESDNRKAVPLVASFTPAYLEKISGMQSPNPKGLELSVQSASKKIEACTAEKTTPDQAGYDVAINCAADEYAAIKVDRKTALEIVPDGKYVVFGATNNNKVRLYHNNLIASYVSPDMTHGDRKREACIVRVMLDHLLGLPASPEKSCVLKP